MRFGTDGIRGPAGTSPIDAEGAATVGTAAARWARRLGPTPTVFVARDTRPSGAALAEAVARGVTAAGARAFDAGVRPTAALSTAIAMSGRSGRTSVGVMVTASHNPARDNGFKVLGPGGWKPDDVGQATLETLLASAPAGGVGEPADDARTVADVAYRVALRQAAGSLRALRGRRLVVDLAHGAATGTWARVVAPWLASLGLDVVVVGGGDGVVNDGVGSEHPQHLAEVVRAVGADGGLAVDGDADRCVLVDETGAVVPGDVLTTWIARGRGVGRLAVTVMSTRALPTWLPGVDVTTTPVGDRHLAALLRADRVDLGAEESGHVLLPGLPSGDGVLAGLVALSAAWTAAPSLSAASARFVPWPRRTAKVRVADRPPLDAVPAVVAAVAAGEARLSGGRVFLRYSGTEPVLRVLVEGRDPAVVDAVAADVEAACRGALA